MRFTRTHPRADCKRVFLLILLPCVSVFEAIKAFVIWTALHGTKTLQWVKTHWPGDFRVMVVHGYEMSTAQFYFIKVSIN